ncbi:unnamed protein product [Effrenium voratum]|nr:unnamed protein product [Effrenium voratum]
MDEQLHQALREMLRCLREQSERARRAEQLELSLRSEMGSSAWLPRLLSREPLSATVEELMEDLAAAQKEDVLKVPFGKEQLLVSAGQNVVDWTMADGRQLWRCCFACLELLTSDAPAALHVEGRRVLELGSGLGLLGLACARLGAASVVLTDYDEALLTACRRSVALNSMEDLVSVQALDWQDVASGGPLPELPPVDLILGADIIYDASHAVSVLGTLRRLLESTGGGEGILVTGEPEQREGVHEVDQALGVEGISESKVSRGSDSHGLIWEVLRVPGDVAVAERTIKEAKSVARKAGARETTGKSK